MTIVRVSYAAVLLDSRMCHSPGDVREFLARHGVWISLDTAADMMGTPAITCHIPTPVPDTSALTKAGLEAAKARGTRLGTPPKVSATEQVRARDLRRAGYSYKAIATILGLSVGTAYRLVNGEALLS